MYKSNSNFCASCPNWADWADLRFGFVHSTDKIEQSKSVYHNQDTSTHIWWIGIEIFFKTSSISNSIVLGRTLFESLRFGFQEGSSGFEVWVQPNVMRLRKVHGFSGFQLRFSQSLAKHVWDFEGFIEVRSSVFVKKN